MIETQRLPRLLPTLTRARRLAYERGRPVPVAVAGATTAFDPLDAFERASPGPRFLWHLIVKRARVQGFLVFEYAARFHEALPQLAQWVRAGKIKYHETVAQGIASAPEAFFASAWLLPRGMWQTYFGLPAKHYSPSLSTSMNTMSRIITLLQRH